MGKFVKRLFGLLLTLVILAGLATAGAIWYVRPQQELTLDHAPLDLVGKVQGMIRSGKAELFLSGEDINNLARSELSDKPQVTPEFRVDGAKFGLQGGLLTADINGRYRDLLDFGLQAKYQLEWRAPNLIATPAGLKLRGLDLPDSLLEPMTIPVGDLLPPLVGIRSVEFRDGGVAVSLELRR
ncbi:hypothetical protein [Paenibacillus herberti]|uniref:DUF2140 domain-containing protein n=1 Tax=Paenibacillus herberti TaxID=1619309 RepID=A0A229NVU3_9BACL|nr:hypothetical protein [Paenibacillus herberti]OXM14063.1 hypothetical protein CGZ75_13825 [Paenibacillus herberti]